MVRTVVFAIVVSGCTTVDGGRNERADADYNEGRPANTADTVDGSDRGSRYPGPCRTELLPPEGEESELVHEYSYDSLGRIINKHTVRFGETGDRAEWTYANETYCHPPVVQIGLPNGDEVTGCPTVQRLYSGGGNPSVYHYEYEDSLLVREEHDNNGDGSVEATSENSFDSDGKLILHTFTVNNNPTSFHAYEYNSSGRLAFHRNYSGSLDTEPISVEAYVYDEVGNLTRLETEYTAEGRLAWITYRYDATGNRIAECTGGTGQNEICDVEHRYNEDNRIIETVSGRRRYTYSYDEQGNLTENTADSDNDGTVDVRVQHTYSCWAE